MRVRFYSWKSIIACTLLIIVIVSSFYIGYLDSRQPGNATQVEFRTTNRPSVIEISPGNGETLTSLFKKIEIKTDMPLQKVIVKVFRMPAKQGIPGKLVVEGMNITFTPENAFLPDSEYCIELIGESKRGKVLIIHKSRFRTETVKGYWVEVKMGTIHTMTVYQGKYPVRMMLASCGRPGHETPRGTFYTGDRGWGFWVSRFNEGAYYWVRLSGPYLVHSVPVDQQWEIKEEEHAKLGLPASHGCVRLSKVDARWFYENVPRGTPVIIHE